MSRLFYSPKASGAQVSILTHTHTHTYIYIYIYIYISQLFVYKFRFHLAAARKNLGNFIIDLTQRMNVFTKYLKKM